MEKENVLISSCLLGENCKYSGGNNKLDEETILFLNEKYNLISVCPEVLGGLLTPREPCERVKDKVFTKSMIDVTKEFKCGANNVLELAKKNNVSFCILKKNSPSCGNSTIYNGQFNGTVIKGRGVTSELLIKHGYKVFNEEEIKTL